VTTLRTIPALTALLCTGLLAPACDAQDETPSFPERSFDAQSCGDDHREFYVFGAINEQLESDAALRDFTGLESVQSCEQAREFVALKGDYLAQDEIVEPEDTLQGDYPVEEQFRIASGSFSNYRPSVELIIREGRNYSKSIRCSGFMIGPQEIVTAAHCIYQDGWRPVRVTMRVPQRTGGGTDVCVANCTNSKTSNAFGSRHPGYTGLGDSADDIGVFVFKQPFSGPAQYSNSWMRMMVNSTWQNAPLKIFGWGANTQSGGGGISREGTTKVSWSGNGHFTSNADMARGCKGDSGGMATRWTTSESPFAVGVLSEMVGSFGDLCPYEDGFNRWTHVGPKIPWIETRIGRNCSRFISSSNSSISYARCF
jgi:hypothetical protein